MIKTKLFGNVGATVDTQVIGWTNNIVDSKESICKQ
jgi:hypothetical protein